MHAHLRLFAIVVIPVVNACSAPMRPIPTNLVPAVAPSCSADPEDPCVDECADGDLDICRDLRIALRRACSPDNGDACHRLALMLETGEGIEHEFGLANALHQRACDFGSGASCARLAFLHSMGDGVNIDFVQAARMVNAACTAKNTVGGCQSLEVLRGDGSLIDWSRGRAIYERACELGHGDGCHALAVMYEVGISVERDRNTAESLYIRACDTGDEHTCVAHRFIFGNRRVPSTAGREETRQYERLCADGDNSACHRLGLVYLRGDSSAVSMGVMLAAHFLGRACRGGIQTACVSRKELLVRRLGVQQIGPSWRVTTSEDCDQSKPLCHDHGLAIAERVGVRPPIALAKPHEVEEIFYRAALYKRACELGHDGGCFRLGTMFADGATLPQRRERAIDFLRLACQEHHNMAGCEALRREIEEPPRPVLPNGPDSQLASVR